jgi:hypothetical protein
VTRQAIEKSADERTKTVTDWVTHTELDIDDQRKTGLLSGERDKR